MDTIQAIELSVQCEMFNYYNGIPLTGDDAIELAQALNRALDLLKEVEHLHTSARSTLQDFVDAMELRNQAYNELNDGKLDASDTALDQAHVKGLETLGDG